MFQTRVVMAVLALLLLGAAGIAAGENQSQPAKKEVTGAVVMACQRSGFLKFKTEDGKEMTFQVPDENLRRTIRGLGAEEVVKLVYVQCPKSGKDIVVEVVRPAKEKPASPAPAPAPPCKDK